MLVVKDDRFLMHLEGVPHLETPKRLRAIHSVFQDPALAGRWTEVRPRTASREELAWVHTSEYIERVASSSGMPLTTFDPDTQASERSYEAARLGVGAVFSLLDGIWSGRAKRGFACIRPPGHHAEPDRAMGFCLFNNVALGARYLQEQYSVRRVMIVDMDVHHGNGTQAAFFDTDEVLYLSFHQFPGYPGTGNFGEVGEGKGEGYTVNVPLGRGYGDRDFARIIYFLAAPLAFAYEPEILLVSCGFDLYVHDRLGQMAVTPEGYALMTFFLLGIAEKICGGRIAFVMEGGYNLRGIRECGLRVMKELCDVPSLTGDKVRKIAETPTGKLSFFRKAVDIHRKYWDVL
ncbi:MAG: histone deacetylase [Deltaproteobacteria bacterium]|nr:histone deacetylase [Deltaproteobacteria bacterium]